MTAAGSDEKSPEAAEEDCVQALREAWANGRSVARAFEERKVERNEPVPERATMTEMEADLFGERNVNTFRKNKREKVSK